MASPVDGTTRTVALVLFAVQLVLNALWSVLLFGISTVAGWLFVTYLLWVSFATVLNFELWRLNPGEG